MADVSMGELLARSAVSLAVVLALVLGAYAVLRRRASGPVPARRRTGGSLFGGRATATTAARGDRSHRTARNGLRVVGRAGVGRSASVTAVQFGERVLLIGAADHGAPTVLAELEGAAWAECTGSVRQLAIPATTASGSGTGTVTGTGTGTGSGAGISHGTGYDTAPRGLLDTLREVTTRRA